MCAALVWPTCDALSLPGKMVITNEGWLIEREQIRSSGVCSREVTLTADMALPVFVLLLEMIFDKYITSCSVRGLAYPFQQRSTYPRVSWCVPWHNRWDCRNVKLPTSD